MAINIQNLDALDFNIKETFHSDAARRKNAESYIEGAEKNPGFSILLLALISKADADPNVRLSSSIILKNYIEEGDMPSIISEDDRKHLKGQIIDVMTNMPENIQKQLGEVISIIGKEDFPDKWPDLLSDMVEKFKSGDFRMINGVLQTANSIFLRYQHEFKSDRLWSEIKLVLINFAQPLTELFQGSIRLLEQYASEPKALNIIVNSLTYICEIFYSLNYQDLPEYFEDNMKIWMEGFIKLLTMSPAITPLESEDNPDIIDVLKSKICDILSLYAQKYDEEFRSYMLPFFSSVWNIAINLSEKPKYDLLIISCMEYLAIAIQKSEDLSQFLPPLSISVPTSLSNDDWKSLLCQDICSKLIIPNMHLRESDVENFEDNPFEYVRFDLESSDIGTRRKAASDLAKALKLKLSPPPLIITGCASQNLDNNNRNGKLNVPSVKTTPEVLGSDALSQSFITFSDSLIAQFNENAGANWKCKDLAFYLYTCIFPPMQVAKIISSGADQTQLMKLFQFLQTHVLSELVNTSSANQINNLSVRMIKADALKFCILYRHLLATNTELLANCTRAIVSTYVAYPCIVIHSYSAIFLDKIFMVTGSKTLLPADQVKDVLPAMVENLFIALTVPGSDQNEFVMKALMRIVTTFRIYITPVITPLALKLTQILVKISKNPTKPYFNHYLFETLCILINNSTPDIIATYMQPMFTVFQEILKNDIQEFVPYVFQEVAALIDSTTNSVLEDNVTKSMYLKDIFPSVVVPTLWDKPGNIPALVRLLMSFLSKYSNDIGTDTAKITAILVIFQKLVFSKANDHEALRLLRYLFQYISPTNLEPYVKQIFVLLFQRLQLAKTQKYMKNLIIFFSFYMDRFGPSPLYALIEGIQTGMFNMTLERVFVPNLLNNIVKPAEKRLCATALIKLLTLCPEFTIQQNPELWCSLLEILVKLLEDTTFINFDSISPDFITNIFGQPKKDTKRHLNGHSLSSQHTLDADSNTINSNTTAEDLSNLLDPPLEEEYRAAFSKLVALRESPNVDDFDNTTSNNRSFLIPPLTPDLLANDSTPSTPITPQTPNTLAQIQTAKETAQKNMQQYKEETKRALVTKLRELNTTNPGLIENILGKVEPKIRQIVIEYMKVM